MVGEAGSKSNNKLQLWIGAKIRKAKKSPSNEGQRLERALHVKQIENMGGGLHFSIFQTVKLRELRSIKAIKRVITCGEIQTVR